MRKIQLLWGTTWRGALWGLILGAILGAVYGVLLILITSLFTHNTNFPVDYVLPVGLVGANVGAILGFVFGPVGGFLVGLLAQAILSSVTYASHYRTIVCIASAIYGMIGYGVGMGFILYLLSADLNQRDIILLDYLIFPACFAGMGAAFAGRRVARWYERESIKGVIQNA